ncbi:type I secretion protein ATPase [Lentibacter sp. XHP0401]|uniref:type I secretion protein ATPase n=1 Tax=Lentibacter sp. XHP0401 TaxID=2984334 RepID=UPI0021E9A2F4|nr:type I secretion protein ATPase [Lentibacter sp. XHP0401]MCV2893429.1 type I secretion protein ATPase [Lentibacter sp. XHP0401]
MLLDRVTEMVAHMFGHFHIALEEARMRDAYDKFQALHSTEQELEALDAANITFNSKYTLDGFTPDINYSDAGPESPNGQISAPYYYGYFLAVPNAAQLIASSSSNIKIPDQPMIEGRPLLTLEPPSSVAVITYQYAFLEDNDLFFSGESEIEFSDPSEFLAELQALQVIAQAITAPLSADMIHPGENANDDAIALFDQIATVETTTLTGLTSTLLHGADASGLHVNGELIDEIPSLEDVMPAFMATSDAISEGAPNEVSEVDGTNEDDYEWPDPFEGLNSITGTEDAPEFEDGHTVVAGANTLINEVSINSAWLDASVISVMGDVVNLDIISQINLLVDRDTGSLGEELESTTLNAAAMSFSSSTTVPDPSGENSTGTTGASVGSNNFVLPSNWAITRIDGDLINLNQIKQYTFQTDNDIADASFSSSSTYIGLGNNTVVNFTNLAELGYGYDLIMIGGNMISVNWISQCNVLIDNDTMSYTGFTPTSLSGGDNLLFNGAQINGVGLDTYGTMLDSFASAANGLATGAADIGTSVAHDSLFEGIEVLRVLYIEGDFTTLNWIEQTNVLGDSDQVHLALDNFQAATDAEINVTAGSNAVVNLASINEYGVDSTVMVGGDTYDDAMLYQAEFIDTDANPLGVNMPALASEAVAFLAEGMIGPSSEPMDAPIVATAPESTMSPDLMQTMLA